MDTATSTFGCPPPTHSNGDLYTLHNIETHGQTNGRWEPGRSWALQGWCPPRLCPARPVPKSQLLAPKPRQCPPWHGPDLRAALGGRAVAAGGLPPSLGCFWPPSSSSRGRQGGAGRRGSLARGTGARRSGAQIGAGPEPGQPRAPGTFPTAAWAAPRQAGERTRGKAAGVGTSRGGSHRDTPSWKLFGKKGAILSRSASQIQYLCQGNGARPVPRPRLGGEREQPSLRGQATQTAQLSEESRGTEVSETEPR